MKDEQLQDFLETLVNDLNYSKNQEHEIKRKKIGLALDTVFNIHATFNYNTDNLISAIDDNVSMAELEANIVKNFKCL